MFYDSEQVSVSLNFASALSADKHLSSDLESPDKGDNLFSSENDFNIHSVLHDS